MKRFIVIAGVNGAGKSTFYSSEPPFGDIPILNLDEIVRNNGDWRNPVNVVTSGRIMLRQIEKNFKNGSSFGQETTLCGKNIINEIKKAKSFGYSVFLYYVGLDNSEIAKERVHYRVDHGGHGIPDEDIERRYYESFSNLKTVLPLCDLAVFYDNTYRFRRFAFFKNGLCVRLSSEVPQWYREFFDNN